MGLGTFLLAMVGPLAKQVMVSLGLAVVTFAGVATAVGSMIDSAKSTWSGGLGGDVAQLVAMSGVNVALGVICGGIVARVTMLSLKRIMPQ